MQSREMRMVAAMRKPVCGALWVPLALRRPCKRCKKPVFSLSFFLSPAFFFIFFAHPMGLEARFTFHKLPQGLALMILLPLLFSVLWVSSACDFYLSLLGSDLSSGDAPQRAFATLSRAHEAATTAATSGCTLVTVHIGAGTWFGPWVFPPAPPAPIVYRGATEGSPTIISGGLELTDFLDSGGLWIARVPAHMNATQLFVGSERRPCARSPNVVGNSAFAGDAFSAASTHAWAAPLCPNCSSSDPVNARGLVFDAGDGIDPSWDFSFAEANIFVSPWSNCVARVGSVTPNNRTLLFRESCGSYGLKSFPSYETGRRWFLENVRGALDAPGEWFLNATMATLEYLPLPGETLLGFTVTLAARPSLLVVSQGGLTFEDLTVVFSAGDPSGNRNGFSQTGAVEVAASGVTLQRITVAHASGNCVLLRPGVARFLLSNATLLDCGGHGVYMDTQDQANDVLITDTRIHGVGFTYLSQPTGILLNGGSNISAVHNEILNSSYTGVSVAWMHGSPVPPTPTPYRFNVSFNRVNNFGMGVLSDFAGVRIAINNADNCFLNDTCYVPTLVQNNVISGGHHFAYGADGLYTDNAVAGVNMLDNIVSDVDGMGYQPHCGVNNSLTNTLIYDARGSRIGNCTHGAAVISGCLGWPVPNASNIPAPFAASVRGNIIVTTQCNLYDTSGIWPNPAGSLYPGNQAASNFTSNQNVYWALESALPLSFPQNMGLDQWRAASGNDMSSIESDPLLKDPENGDYTPLPRSPAWALGWRAIDAGAAGPRGK